jgi:hypothetical protein
LERQLIISGNAAKNIAPHAGFDIVILPTRRTERRDSAEEISEMTMILWIGNRFNSNVRDLAHASEVYARERDESGEGASTFPNGRIMKGGRKIANVSYNARVWPKEGTGPGFTPLYDPSGFLGDPQDLPRDAQGRCILPTREAPRYIEVPEHEFDQYKAITLRHSGSADQLREPADWTDDLSFVAGSAGAAPAVGDIVLLNQINRIDGFTADGRFFVLYES